MERRRFLRGIGGCLAAVSLAGCTGAFADGDRSSDYPGGTLVITNTGDGPVPVSIRTKLDEYDASLDTVVAGGETVVRREFVSARRGDIVSLEALLGETGERLSFQFLPEGSGDSPPEVAELTFENAVEASASWTATGGT
ncbi:hypothetical protein EXE44_16705 [Halorubrum sp. SS7]|nr:hypothetical protein EXE44_16705 [Halorubrum sp. SS7]